MTARRPWSGRPSAGPDRVLMMPPFLGHPPSPAPRNSAPDCEVGASPHIPSGRVVGLLRHHPARTRGRPLREGGPTPPGRKPQTTAEIEKGRPRHVHATTTEQDNLQSRLPDPAQFFDDEVAAIAGA